MGDSIKPKKPEILVTMEKLTGKQLRTPEAFINAVEEMLDIRTSVDMSDPENPTVVIKKR